MVNKKEVEVTYADTDAMGVVYHANYLIWFEMGRNSFFKSFGYNIKDSTEKGIIFPIKHIDITYKVPSKYGDEIIVTTEVVKIKKTSTKYLQKVYANDILSCQAYVTIAHVDANSFKPVNIKDYLPDVYNKYLEVMIDE